MLFLIVNDNGQAIYDDPVIADEDGLVFEELRLQGLTRAEAVHVSFCLIIGIRDNLKI